MRLAVVALLLIGCKKDYEDFTPVGGGGSGMTGVTDALRDSEIDTPTDAVFETGRVCVVADLRKLTVCDPNNSDDIAVDLGTAHGNTGPDGTFQIDLPSGTGLTWKVSHPDFVTAISEFGPSLTLNTMRAAKFDALLSTNGIILTGGVSSSVVVQVLGAGNAPLAGATVATVPVALFAPRYDGNSATIWDPGVTGAFGVAWVPGTTGTSTELTVTPPTGTPVMLTVPLLADAITFVTVSF